MLPSKYAVSFPLDHANYTLLIDRLGWQSVSGAAFVLACVAAGDIPFRRPDLDRGVILEIGLDPHNGARACGRWRDVLSGRASLLASTPPPASLRTQVEPSTVRFYQTDRSGHMPQLGADDPLWMQR